MSIRPIEMYENRDKAIEYLAQRLIEGSVALVLGAGSSKPMGMPTFKELLEKSFKSIGHVLESDNLEIEASRLEDKCHSDGVDFVDTIHKALYSDGKLANKDLIESKRLSAYGAMLMGSRRGSVQTVLTLNYDSSIEEYLELHGYSSRIVTQMPSLTGAEDVTIFHVCGYLPSKNAHGERSEEIIITKQSMNNRIGERGNRWNDVVRKIVTDKILLLIGLSDDTIIGGFLGPILQSEANEIRKKRPTGFWIFSSEIPESKRKVLKDQNVIPIKLDNNDEIDDFILEICRKAATVLRDVHV